LGKIESPRDLKLLSEKELDLLAAEIRSRIVETVSKNGGHLASNLGVVELTIALHRVFDSPNDKIIWDVGHQAYTHKLLTGRAKDFHTLCKLNGISGLVRMGESEHDCFVAGHSSTAVSAALGFAKAKEMVKDSGYVISVIGDGSLTGGQVFEGFNNAGHSAKNFIVILNDNEMAINKNIGGLAKYLNKIRLSGKYFEFKSNLAYVLERIPLIGKFLVLSAKWFKNLLKHLVYQRNIFENLGFDYLGPVDGHDIRSLSCVLKRARKCSFPVIVHVSTRKGKGHELAETDPDVYHSVSQRDSSRTFSSEFGKIILEFAKENEKICAITAAMRDCVGFLPFSQVFPERFFDVGIAEQHAITFAAGLAASGFVPVVAIYSTFLQRAYDQLLHDVSISNFHVVLGVDRAGVVGVDGETHQGVFDVAFLSELPNTTIYSPSDFFELKRCLNEAVHGAGLCAVRYPKGREFAVSELLVEEHGDYIHLPQHDLDILIVTYGRLFGSVSALPQRFRRLGLSVSLLKMIKIHPILSDCLEIAVGYRTVIFLEEGIRTGSVAEQFGAKLLEMNGDVNYFVKAIDDKFVPQGSINEQLAMLGLDSAGIESFVRSVSLAVGRRGNRKKNFGGFGKKFDEKET
jgi:1-deoxy-D-xylulose-5-phosphate synthase